jgi:hypothetical protein
MAGGNPAFGSPEWEAKYGHHGAGPAPRPPVGMPPQGMQQPQMQQPTQQPAAQPNAELGSVVNTLHAAIQSEPEPADKQALEQALQIIEAVNAKNHQEGAGGEAHGGPA